MSKIPKKKPDNDNSIPKGWSPVTRVNICWIIGLIFATVVVLICLLFNEDTVVNGDKIISFISNGALLLSITLSIMAIQLTYTSNSQTERHFENFNKIAHKISELYADIRITSNKLGDNVDKIINRLDDINTTMKEAGFRQENKIPAAEIPTDNPNKINNNK